MAIAAVAGFGLASTLISGAVMAAGAVYSGMAAASAYKYQAGIAEMNAKVARQNAAYETALGETKAQQEALKGRQQLGAIGAQLGASGLAYGSGTSKDILGSEAEILAFDQETIRGNASRRAYGFETEALSDEYQAKADRSAATNSMISGGINAFSSILGAGGSFSDKWLKAQQMGINPSESMGLS